MKVEMSESLCYSYLRHVKRCWLVQTNWKSSEHWIMYRSGEDLEEMYQNMKGKFDRGGEVFKKTKTASQFMKQGEIDVIGVDQEGGVHALDVAFHESGLLYGDGNDNRVLKKLLRTYMLLHAYCPPGTGFYIYFVLPKVMSRYQGLLEATFQELRTEYTDAQWNLIANDDFTNQVMHPTLDKTAEVADTAELFARAAKLMNVSGMLKTRESNASVELPKEDTPVPGERIQPLVKSLMKTLLQDHPTLLDDSDRRNLMDANYCANELGLKINNFSLLRSRELGPEVTGYSRYWKELYGGQFYVCSQWPKMYHIPNARRLSRFLDDIVRKRQNHQGIRELRTHIEALNNYAQ